MSMFENWNVDQLRGAHATLRYLDTSPRFNKPQREIIHEVAADVAHRLRGLEPKAEADNPSPSVRPGPGEGSGTR